MGHEVLDDFSRGVERESRPVESWSPPLLEGRVTSNGESALTVRISASSTKAVGQLGVLIRGKTSLRCIEGPKRSDGDHSRRDIRPRLRGALAQGPEGGGQREVDRLVEGGFSEVRSAAARGRTVPEEGNMRATATWTRREVRGVLP